MRLAVPALLATAAACAPPRPTTPTAAGPARCLDLAGTNRASLRLGPDGQSLYWYEQVPFYGFTSAWPRNRIARWDTGDAPARAVTDLMGAPFRVLPDGDVVGVADSGVVLWRDGVGQLISAHDAIEHLEVLGAGDAVVYAAAGALWRQPLHRVAATRLTSADVLVGVDGDTVVFWRGEALVARHARTGAERALAAPDGELLKILGTTLIVRRDDGLATQPSAGGPATVVLPGAWVTLQAPDGIRAWRAAGDHLEAAIVTATGVVRLPDVRGGDALAGFVRMPDGRVAYLVGHDLDGDGDVTTSDEHDVCVGPGDRPLAVPPRHAPRRWQAAVPALDALARTLGADGYRFAASGEIPALTFTGVGRAADRPRRWADARAAGAGVATALGDPSFNVIVEYADGGRALAEWDAPTGRRVSWAGVGGALVPDPADYQVEITTDTLARDDAGLITCAGAVTNRTDRALDGLAVDCVGGEGDTAIPVFPTTLPPGQVARFAGTTAGDADGNLLVSVHRPAAGENLLTYEPARAARYVRIAAAAAEVVDRTRLTVWDWSGGVEVGVELWAPADFTGYSDAARAMAAEIAYDVLAKVDRAVFLGDAAAPLGLTIHAGGAVWRYDGSELTAGAAE